MTYRISLFGSRAGKFLLLVFVLLFAVAIYWPALQGPFLLDDFVNIPQTRLDILSWESVTRVAASNESGSFGRPIPAISFALNYYLAGESIYWFKLFNLILHLVNGVLLYSLLTLLFRILYFDGFLKERYFISLLALLLTAVWTLHPLQLSGVMYVVQRMNMMSTFFTFLALLVFVRFRAEQITHERSVKKHDIVYICALLGIIVSFAALSKENGVLSIIYIVWFEIVVFKFRKNKTDVDDNYRKIMLLIVIVFMVSGGIYLYLNQSLLMDGYLIRDHGMAERLMTQPRVILFYIKQIVVPDLGMMGIYFDDFRVSRSFDLITISSITVLMGLSVGILYWINKQPMVCLGFGLFLLSHVMESTIIPLEMVFEHRNYFGLWGVWLAIAGVLIVFIDKVKKPIVYGLLTLIVSFLSIQTHARAQIWSDELKHSAFAAESRPMSIRSQTAFAIALARSGKLAAAEKVMMFSQNKSLDPAYTALQLISLKGMRNAVTQNDIEHAIEAIKKQPLMARHGTVLTDIYINFKKNQFVKPTTHDLLRLFNVSVTHGSARLKNSDRARMLGMYAELLMLNDQFEESVQRINEAYSHQPNDPEIIVRKFEYEFKNSDFENVQSTLALIIKRQAIFSDGQLARVKRIVEQSSSAELVNY